LHDVLHVPPVAQTKVQLPPLQVKSQSARPSHCMVQPPPSQSASQDDDPEQLMLQSSAHV
jgi:hypothetical protein